MEMIVHCQQSIIVMENWSEMLIWKFSLVWNFLYFSWIDGRFSLFLVHIWTLHIVPFLCIFSKFMVRANKLLDRKIGFIASFEIFLLQFFSSRKEIKYVHNARFSIGIHHLKHIIGLADQMDSPHFRQRYCQHWNQCFPRWLWWSWLSWWSWSALYPPPMYPAWLPSV